MKNMDEASDSDARAALRFMVKTFACYLQDLDPAAVGSAHAALALPDGSPDISAALQRLVACCDSHYHGQCKSPDDKLILDYARHVLENARAENHPKHPHAVPGHPA